MRGGTIAMANHYRSGKFAAQNKGWDSGIIAHSKDRARLLEANLKCCGPRASLERVAGCLDDDPVLNEETRQMMAFDPRRGEMLVWSI
jgi:hypothetical protein